VERPLPLPPIPERPLKKRKLQGSQNNFVITR